MPQLNSSGVWLVKDWNRLLDQLDEHTMAPLQKHHRCALNLGQFETAYQVADLANTTTPIHEKPSIRKLQRKPSTVWVSRMSTMSGWWYKDSMPVDIDLDFKIALE